jgi:hypothetical protein
MQQKRKSSLARLKAAAELQAQSALKDAPAHVANLVRMIADTEAAIEKGGR